MTPLRWLWATVRHRGAQTVAAALAIGLAVAYLAALGSFASATRADLAVRAAARVPVDWQVQLTPGVDPAAVRAVLANLPGVSGSRTVDIATVPGLRSTTSSGTRTTGKAYVVGLPSDYASFAPDEIRPLLGDPHAVALQQQTAANLAAAVGDTVSILGGPTVRIGGVIDFPAADSLFQVVGAPAGAGATAPPDNVLAVPAASFPALTVGRTVVHQVHLRFDHTTLPRDPGAAADAITHRANNVAVQVAGGALIGDNLGAALLAAREDALYASLLVLLLGAPGAVLAAVVAALVVALRAERTRRELGVLRLRGASPAHAALLVGSPALIDGAAGCALGTLGAAAATRALRHTPLDATWLAVAVGLGFVLALATALWPVLRLTRAVGVGTVTEATSGLPSTRSPLPLRLGLDLVLLGFSGLVLYLSSRNGYQVVVVPEGLPVASVNYAALLAPALAWPGLGLLVWRITAALAGRRRRTPATDPAGRIPDLRAAALRRRRRPVARGATGLALALALAVSTAMFTTTYHTQARLDVALSVGSDVAVTVPPDTARPGLDPARAAAVPGVRTVAPMLHRLAYVGPDLQDLYGIDPARIGLAAPLLDAFTPGTSIRSAMSRLAGTPDGALVSQETLHDYQLHPGDLLRLRLRDGAGTYRIVPFHVTGVVTEFATAPRDSFVVANAAYVAAQTTRAEPETLLVRTDAPARVAAALRAVFSGPGVRVADIRSETAAVTTASGLAATDLSGLARLAVGFGVLLAIAAAALALVVGATQRTRSLVALGLLGANARQRVSFLRGEAQALLAAGVFGGAIGGLLIAYELVKVLTGIFDPPPQHVLVPWGPLLLLLGAIPVAGGVVVAALGRWATRLDPGRLRDF